MNTPTERQNPYVGPRSFSKGELLYGRDREKRNLLDLLIAQRVVLLHSPSGAGKSSLINAGLIKNLEEERFRVLPVARVHLNPQNAMGAELLQMVTSQAGSTFNRYVYSILLSFEENLEPNQRRPLDELACSTLEDYLACCLPKEGEPEDIVLIFDQFEEIITANPTDRDGKMAFFSQLGQVLQNQRCWALFAMREDYVPALDPYVRLVPTRLANTFRLDFLGEAAARQAIQNPARDQGVIFSKEAADKLIEDLRTVQVQQPDGTWESQPGLYVEPVQLQVVCSQLWDRLHWNKLKTQDGKPLITPADLDTLGDVGKSLVDQSLAQYYADRVKKVAEDTGVSERAVREWVQGELITEGGVRGLVLYTATASKGLKNEAIWGLVGSHLVRSDKRAEKTWFELAHDRLIDPVRDDNARWRSENLNLLQRQVGRWASLDRPDNLLMRGQDLADAQAWAFAHPEELTDPEKDFLKKSQEIAQEEERDRLAKERELKQSLELESAQKLAEAERQRAEEQEKYARRLSRYLRLLIGAIALAALAVLAVFILGAVARNQTATAQAVATQATAQAVVAQATATSQAADAAAMAAQATVDAAAAAATSQAVEAQATTDAVAAAATAQAAEAQAAAAQATASAVAALATAQSQEILPVKISKSLAASSQESLTKNQPDLALLLAVEAFNTYDTEEARAAIRDGLLSNLTRVSIPSPRGLSTSAQLNQGGSKVAWGNNTGLVQLQQTENNKITEVSNRGESPIRGLAFSQKSEVVAGVDDLGWIHFWDAIQGKSIYNIKGLRNTYLLAFNGTKPMTRGSILAAAGTSNGAIYLWDTFFKTNFQPESLVPKTGPRRVSALAWSPDGSQLASGDTGGSIRLWSTENWQDSLSPARLPGAVTTMAWSPDGLHLVAGGEDPQKVNNLLLWEIGSAAQPNTFFLSGHSSRVTSVAFSPDGKTLASGDATGRVYLWDPASKQPIGKPLAGLGASVNSLAFSPDGSSLYAVGLAESGQGFTVKWDLRALLKDTPPETLVQLACQQAARPGLTLEEWKTFFYTQNYRPTCPEPGATTTLSGTPTPTPTP